MRCRFEEVMEMVLVRTFQSLAKAQEFIDNHMPAVNEKFIVGVSGGKPAVYCQVRRRVYR